jgi:hypothetical protein
MKIVNLFSFLPNMTIFEAFVVSEIIPVYLKLTNFVQLRRFINDPILFL